MAKSLRRVHHLSRADTHTFDGASLVNTKKLIYKMKQFDAITVLIKRIIFLQRDAQERGLNNLHHGGKRTAS